MTDILTKENVAVNTSVKVLADLPLATTTPRSDRELGFVRPVVARLVIKEIDGQKVCGLMKSNADICTGKLHSIEFRKCQSGGIQISCDSWSSSSRLSISRNGLAEVWELRLIEGDNCLLKYIADGAPIAQAMEEYDFL